ncbi:MAG: ROK family protein, partial [Nocardiopsaceae bacterium]|nr:ROK family protein [Nocardiopsaceae bacterium]
MDARTPESDMRDGGVVDVGGTKVMVGVARDGVLVETTSFSTRDYGDAEAITEMIASAGRGLAEHNCIKVQAAAVGLPGILDREAGVVRHASNLPFHDYPLASELSRRLGGVPVTLEHDANCGVLAETIRGAGQGSDSVVFLTVSTGIGMGTMLRGKLIEGARGAAGEIGHVTVMPGGRACICGRAGCLEAYASGAAIAKMGRDALLEGNSLTLASLAAEPGRITAREVVAAAPAGDEA